MSKISIFIVVLLAAAVWCLPTPDEDSNVPEGYCHDGALHIKEGETVPAPIGECNKITCQDAKQNYLTMLTCSAFIPAPGCHQSPKDLTKPYPHCCPKSVCDDEE